MKKGISWVLMLSLCREYRLLGTDARRDGNHYGCHREKDEAEADVTVCFHCTKDIIFQNAKLQPFIGMESHSCKKKSTPKS